MKGEKRMGKLKMISKEKLKKPKSKTNLNLLVNRVKSLESKVKKILNEPSISVMIKEKGAWGEWTGLFYLNDDEKTEVLLNKVEEHFKKHFNSDYYKDKEFALFKNINREKTLHKIL